MTTNNPKIPKRFPELGVRLIFFNIKNRIAPDNKMMKINFRINSKNGWYSSRKMNKNNNKIMVPIVVITFCLVPFSQYFFIIISPFILGYFPKGKNLYCYNLVLPSHCKVPMPWERMRVTLALYLLIALEHFSFLLLESHQFLELHRSRLLSN